MPYLFLILLLVAAPASAQRSDSLRLSIGDAVTRALRASGESRLAAAQIEVAEAQITTARAAGLPQLRVNGSYTQVLENARATIVGSVFGQNFTYNTNANLSQTLFQGGRVFAGSRAAADVRRAARYDQAEVRAQLSVSVQRAYLQSLFAAQLLDIQSRNLELASDRLRQVEQLERAGRAARYDVLRARVERANLEPALIAARSERELALLELKRLLDIPVAQPLVLTSALDAAALEALVEGMASDSAPDPVRPSVRAAQAVADARREGIRVARADLLPTVSMFIQSGFLALPSNNGFPTSFGRSSTDICPPGSPSTRVCQNNGWFADRNFGVNVQWPLFDGLRAKGNIDLAQAQSRIADIQLEQEREATAIEKAQARAEFDRARAAFQAQAQNATEADEAFRLATLRFSRGVGTQLDVSDAQLALLTARTNEVRSGYDLYLASAELARARGVTIPLPPIRQSTPPGSNSQSGSSDQSTDR
jgi:outer membrane protein TolC